MAGKKGWSDNAKGKMVDTRKTNREKRDKAIEDLNKQEKKGK